VSSRCPSELELEEFLADPATSPRRRHIGRCASCQAELERMRREGEEFEKVVHPGTADAVQRALEE